MTEKMEQNWGANIELSVTEKESKENVDKAVAWVKSEVIKNLSPKEVESISLWKTEYCDKIRFRYSHDGGIHDAGCIDAVLGFDQPIAGYHFDESGQKSDFWVQVNSRETGSVTKKDWDIFIGKVGLLLEEYYKERGVEKPDSRHPSFDDQIRALREWKEYIQRVSDDEEKRL